MTQRMLLFIWLALTLPGCLFGNDGFKSEAGSVEVEPPCIPGKCTETATADKTAREGIPFEFTFTTTNPGPYYYVKYKPSWMLIDEPGNRIYGTPTESTNITGMKIMIHDLKTTDVIGPFALDVFADPLAKYAWHLNNTGQTGFSTGGGKAGEDAKITAAVAQGFTGSGVHVAVSDTGVEISHEDLTDNVLPGESRNYDLVAPYTGDPTPPTGDEGHGTSVAGLIAAKGWNNKGSRGVAPDASFAGFYFIGPTESVAKLVHQATGAFDIFNQSWGYPTCYYTPVVSTYLSQIKERITNGRGGKGSLFVKSAGNSYVGDWAECTGLVTPGLYPYLGNANFDGDNTHPYVILAAAVNASGAASSYSSPGSNVWISAPGGEFGSNSPAMITTDMAGCSAGISVSSNTTNSFDSGASALNSGCKYTSTMNGTSSAAPVTSGVIALMLEAKPTLGWRDVKHILASSATVIQPSTANIKNPLGYDLAQLPYQRGWITNSAGYKFHNWYGFGRINANTAVTMAKNYGTNLPAFEITEHPLTKASYYSTGVVAVAVPDESATGASRSFSVLHNLVAEEVTLKITVNHPRPSDLAVEVISPAGTKNYVANYNSMFLESIFIDVMFLSNAFYGESTRGTWTVKVYDAMGGQTGSITSAELKFYGHVNPAPTDTTAPAPIASITVPATAPSLVATPTVVWTASPDTDVMRYEYSIGTSSGGTEVLTWTSAGSALTIAQTGLTLTSGNTYYFNVRAVDTSENKSTVVTGSFAAP